jgi:hypothetical protein
MTGKAISPQPDLLALHIIAIRLAFETPLSLIFTDEKTPPRPPAPNTELIT